MDNALDQLLKLIASAVVLGGASFGLEFLQLHIKDKRVKRVLGWVQQGVAYAEETGFNGAWKKSMAVDYVNKHLAENKYTKRFDETQVKAMIEMAVNQLKDSAGHKPHAEVDDVAITGAVSDTITVGGDGILLNTMEVGHDGQA